jgi:hypothetical protein
MARVIPAPFGLTGQQREWYESLVPDVPEEAVAQLVHEYGCHGQEEDLLQEAYIGTKKGVETFDLEKAANGAEDFDPVASGALRTWVFFSALHAAQAVLRRENRQSSRIVGRVWNGVIEVCKHTPAHTPVILSSRAADRAGLTEFRGRVAAAPVVAVGVMEIPTGEGEDDLHERATATRVEAVLRDSVSDLSGRRHELLRLHFADGLSAKGAATVRGERGYRAELLEFHKALDQVAARFAHAGFAGFNSVPPFPPEARGTILRESGDTPSQPVTPKKP